MIGGTVIEYGANPRAGLADFVLYHCTTHSVTQEPVFDDTGTDMLYYRITVRVTGIVHGVTAWTKYNKRQLYQSVNSTAAFEHRGLRSELDNRQTFRMRMGVTDDTNPNSGKELVYAEPWPNSEVPAPAGGMLHWDVNDGPRCEVFAVDHVTDNTVFRVSATFTVCVVECDPASTGDPGTAKNNKQGILSNRWSSSDEIDANQLTVRTYTGRLRVASSKINPHLVRAVIVPPLLTGLRRDRMTFTASADGKTLDYSIVDREVISAAPAPARTWDISHTADTDQAMLTMHSMSVRLAGDRTADPRKLIAIAMYVIREKLYDNLKTITKRFTVQADTGEQNSVRVSCDVLIPGKKHDFGAGLVILAAYKTVGTPITLAQLPVGGRAYDPNISTGAAAGDEIRFDGPVRLTGIFHARLQSPCDDAHNIDKRAEGGSQNGGDWPAQQPQVRTNPGTGPGVEVLIVDEVAPEQSPSELSPGHQSAPYTSYTTESLYATVGMRAAMPIARSSSTTTTAGPSNPGSVGLGNVPVVNNTSAAAYGSEDSVKIIKLSQPTSKRVVRIRGERVGDWPKMPRPTDYQLYQYQAGTGNTPAGRAVVNDVRFLPGTTEMTPTGERLYRAHLDVEYLLTRPVDASHPLRVGNNPWDTIGLQLTSGAAMFADESAVGISQ